MRCSILYDVNLFNPQDRIHFHPARGRDCDNIADFAAQECFAHGGFVGDQAGGWFRLVGSDQRIAVFAAVGGPHLHGRTERDFLG